MVKVNFMLATAGTIVSAVVTVLAVLLGIYTMMLVGRMRGKHGVMPGGDRCSRIRAGVPRPMILSSSSVLFLPLSLACKPLYPVVSDTWPLALDSSGCGRVLYSSGYMRMPPSGSFRFLKAESPYGIAGVSIVGIVHACW